MVSLEFTPWKISMVSLEFTPWKISMVSLEFTLSGIVVDHDCYVKEQYLPRMRFFFAHEMGHYFLHQDLYSRVLFHSREEWKAFILALPE